MGWVARLRASCEADCAVYHRDHRDPWNRALHALCVPVEFGALTVLAAAVLSRRLATAAACACAIASVVARPTPRGAAAAALCVACACLAATVVGRRTTRGLVLAALGAEAAAWTLQVAVGHGILERNTPTVARSGGLTATAVVLTVLIAWSDSARRRKEEEA